jgi:urease accessory protein
MTERTAPLTVGVYGPVGSGKTALISEVVPRLRAADLTVGVIATDVTNTEDATVLRERLDGVVSTDLVVGVIGDSEPRTDHSAHLETFRDSNPDLDMVLVESSGDTTVTTAPDCIDYSLFVISVAEGDDIPRKRGAGVVGCDLLVVNKTDLAEHAGASLGTIERDARTVRDGPFIFTDCKTGAGIEAVVDHIERATGRVSSA